ILPNAQGVAFGFLIFAMLLGAMNYNNSLGLAITFLMAGLALVTMHHCHRNLSGLSIRYGGDRPAFVGQKAAFRITLINDSATPRFGLTLRYGDFVSDTVHIDPGQHETLTIEVDATRRGRLELDRISLYTTFPLGLFHCWAWIHPRWQTIVFPKPAPAGLTPPPQHTDTGGANADSKGDADFAGLRNYRAGDSPKHIAWKAYARGQELLVKQYAGTDVASHWFDFNSLDQMALEARLSQLTRWIVDANLRGTAWGLRLPSETFEPQLGPAHRDRCLTALALM
ncbi:MAG: DUF58 domain-containing protein, partial [Gammaproteobacteria bacterium]|nr:DUF58 domain-containing protein [Gammaproteobacteria bacterium]